MNLKGLCDICWASIVEVTYCNDQKYRCRRCLKGFIEKRKRNTYELPKEQQNYQCAIYCEKCKKWRKKTHQHIMTEEIID